jgi:hypothetical protein
MARQALRPASLASAAPGAFGLRGAFEGKMLGAESKMDE